MINISSLVSDVLTEVEDLDWRAGHLAEWLNIHVPDSERVCRDLEVATRNAVQLVHEFIESQR